MKKLLFLFLSFPAICLAEGPIFDHKSPIIQQEFENVYQDVGSVLQSSGTSRCIDAPTLCVDTVNNYITTSSTAAAQNQIPRFGQIKVLQVVQSTIDTSSATSTASSFVPTAHTVSITPSNTSSKVFVIASGILSTSDIESGAYATILRGSTNLGNTGGFCGILTGGATIVNDSLHLPCTMQILDSPATTSAVTYRVAIRRDGSHTATWNSGSIAARAVITAFEINGL